MKDRVIHTIACAFVLAMITVACFMHCGCGMLGQRAVAAVDTAKYETDLDGCLKQAHKVDAGKYAFYESCASRVDRAHGKDGGQ